MHMLIEVSRILEGFICTPRGMVVEVRCPRRDLPTEEKKTTKENIKRKIKAMASRGDLVVKMQVKNVGEGF